MLTPNIVLFANFLLFRLVGNMENDKDGNEGLSSKKMKLIDDEQKEVDKLTEEKNLLTSMATFFPDLVAIL